VSRLKLTTYFGESDRVGGHLLCDALLDLHHRRAVATGILLRGVEGFGVKHHLRSDRLLTLSEDLPLVSVAVDQTDRIIELAEAQRGLVEDGLMSLERVSDTASGDSCKLTAYRDRGTWRRTAEAMESAGMAGVTALLGVDGVIGGERRRATFAGGNASVPVMVIGVGDAGACRRALSHAALTGATVERVTLCKGPGSGSHAPPPAMGDAWQKLMIHAGEDARHGGHALHPALVRRLREAGAAGATTLRAVWGLTGARRPHADHPLSLRRRVPMVTVVVDSAEQVSRWFEIVDHFTATAGLVTCEHVPAHRTAGGGAELGSLVL
jgi:PII-like signaling protein